MNKFHQPDYLPSFFIFSNMLFSAQGLLHKMIHFHCTFWKARWCWRWNLWTKKERSNM